MPLTRTARLALIDRLVDDHPALPAGSVQRCLTRWWSELTPEGVRDGRPQAVEVSTRSRRRARS